MEGDGIGPEITAATLTVLRQADRAFALALSFTPVVIGLAALRAHGTTLPASAVDAAKAADGVILGPVSHNEYPPVTEGGRTPSGELASSSTCSLISGRRAPAAASRRAAVCRSIW
jgi:isocitrate/isopropylmalate dehydrogenase